MREALGRILTREYWLVEERSLVAIALAIGVLSGLAVGPIVSRAAPETRGHGVPEVMLAVARSRGVIRARVAVLKAVASAITIGTGGSAGREGPIVQIGSAVGSALGARVHANPEMVRMFVACGAAGGIVASFNTPIAGVIFALEVILRDFAGRAFATVVIFSVTASVVARTLLGQQAFFHAPAYALGSSWELLPYALLGVAAAFVARAFVLTLYRIEDAFDALRVPAALKPALGGLCLGALAWFVPDVLGTGHHAIERALRGEIVLSMLAVLVVAKLFATSFTLGSGGFGGVFAPSLFIGAMLVGAVGHGVDFLVPGLHVQPGAYALVGMGAVFAGATWASISAIVILFEMTRDYDLILPMMICCVTSVVVAKQLSSDTIYTLKLRRRGVNLDEEPDSPLARVPVESAMTRDVETIGVDTPLRVLLRQVEASDHSGFPVVDENGALKGLITYAELRDGMQVAGTDTDFIIASDVMRPFGPVLHPGSNLEEAVHKMRHAALRPAVPQ